MKNKKLKRKGSNKKPVVVLSLLTLVVAGLLIYFALVKQDPASLNQEEQQSAEQVDVDEAKQRVEESTKDEPLKDEEDEAPIVSEPVTLSALTFSQGGGLVNSSVSVSGAESGACTFIFTDGDGRAISKTANLGSGTCSVSVSEAEFTMIGEYNLTAKFADKSISKTITIN